MNAWEKTCDTWRLLAAEINGSFNESTVSLPHLHLAELEKQYRNWKISFKTTGHTITGSVSYVPRANFTLHAKRKRFDWTDQIQNIIPPLFMLGTPVTSMNYPEIEYLYSVTSSDANKAKKIMESALLRDVLMNCGQMQNFLICSMHIGAIEAGSVFLYDLGQPSNRADMKNRIDLFQETLDELEHLDLAAPDAPQASTHQMTDDLFSRFNIFKRSNSSIVPNYWLASKRRLVRSLRHERHRQLVRSEGAGF